MEKQRYKRDLLYKLWGAFNVLSEQKHAIKFSYFVAKNKNILQSEIEILEKLREPSSGYKEYDQKRVDMAQRWADRDEQGNVRTENGSFVLEKNKVKFEKEFTALKNKYKNKIDEFEKQIKDFKNMLEDKTEFYGHKIKVENLPAEIEPQLIELFMATGLLDD